jgi:hypothetical protein
MKPDIKPRTRRFAVAGGFSTPMRLEFQFMAGTMAATSTGTTEYIG